MKIEEIREIYNKDVRNEEPLDMKEISPDDSCGCYMDYEVGEGFTGPYLSGYALIPLFHLCPKHRAPTS